MNERLIKELAELSGASSPVRPYMDANLQKFADLIILECTEVVEKVATPTWKSKLVDRTMICATIKHNILARFE